MLSKVTYLGDLRTQSIHLNSGSEVISDAPVDNNGKGEAFSPTDMLANSLATCMLTIMAIKANSMDIELKGATAEVVKVMQAAPRKISKIEVVFQMNTALDKASQTILERVALACPVYLSLHPDIEKAVQFNWI